MSETLGARVEPWALRKEETQDAWKERQISCLDCNKELETFSPSGQCEACSSILVVESYQPALEEAELQDGGLAAAQERSLAMFDYVRALEIAATRLKLAMTYRVQAVPELLLEMAPIFRSLGDEARCEAYVQKALSMFREEGRSQGVAKASSELVRVRQEQDGLDRGLSRCQDTLQELASYGDKNSQSVVELTMAHLYETTGLYAQAHPLYHRLAYANTGGPRVRMQALLGLGRCLTALIEYDMAFSCYEDALKVANQTGLSEFRAQVGLGQAALALAVRDLELSGQCLAWANSQVTRLDAAQKVEILLLQGRHALLAGYLEQADKLFNQAVERAAGQHVSASVAWTRYYLAKVRQAQGKSEEARALGRDALRRAQARDLRELAVSAATLIVELERHLPLNDEWEGMILEAHSKAKELRLPELLWRTSLSMAYLSEARGESEMERRYLGQALNLLEEMRQKSEQFGRSEFFFTDKDRLRLYQHWARRMLDWNQRPHLERVAEDCEEPVLADILRSMLGTG